MATPAEAKAFYEWLVRTRDLSHGLRFTRDNSQLHLIQDWDWVFDGARIEKVGEKQIIVLSSPWHACVFLYHQMALWANDEVSKEPRLTTAKDLNIESENLPPISLLFRGQRNPSAEWKIESSLNRKTGTMRSEALSAGGHFAALLQRTISECGFPFVDSLALTAAAQHYGISTDLLDFSTDPAVAIYFANEKPDDPDIGVVFGISLAKAWNRFGFKLVLPPPFIERLYIQRGVFLEFDYDRADEFRQECIEVRFVKHAGFAVVRSDKPETSILKDDSYLRFLASNSLEWAAAGNRWHQASETVRQMWLADHFGKIRNEITENFSRALVQDAIGLWMNHSVDLLESLSVARMRTGIKLVSNVIESLVLNNPILSTLISSYYYGQFYAFHGMREIGESQGAFTYQMAREISKYLAAVSAGDLIPRLPIDHGP